MQAGPKLHGEAADLLRILQLRSCRFQNLPETAERVETHVSHRKQKTAHPSTRDTSHGDFRPLSHRTTNAGGTPALPNQPPNNPLDHLLTVQAPACPDEGRGLSPAKERRRPALYLSSRITRAKCRSSNPQPLTANFENLIDTPERLETPVTYRKQKRGHTSNRYRSRATLCVEF